MLGKVFFTDENVEITDVIMGKMEFKGEEIFLFGNIGKYSINKNSCTFISNNVEKELDNLSYEGKKYIKNVKNDFINEGE